MKNQVNSVELEMVYFSSRKMSIQKSNQQEEREQLLLLRVGLLR